MKVCADEKGSFILRVKPKEMNKTEENKGWAGDTLIIHNLEPHQKLTVEIAVGQETWDVKE